MPLEDQKPAWEEGVKTWLDGSTASDPFIDTLVSRVKDQNKDCVVLTVGEEGQGKSVLDVELAILTHHQITAKVWDPWRYLLFTKQQVIGNLIHPTPMASVVYEESGASWYKREFMTKGNRRMNQTFMTNRSYRQLWFFNTPTRGDLDIYVSQRLKYFIKLDDETRGVGHLYQVWVDRWGNIVGREYIGQFTFPDLPPNVYEIYNGFKKHYQEGQYLKVVMELQWDEVKEFFTDKQRQIYKMILGLWEPNDGGVLWSELEDHFNPATLSKTLKMLERKGLIVKAEGEGNYGYSPSIGKFSALSGI